MSAQEDAFRAMARDVIALLRASDAIGVSPERTETIIAGALAACAATEREVCAQIADAARGTVDNNGRSIRDAIRARGAS